jgi:hypothetical protein
MVEGDDAEALVRTSFNLIDEAEVAEGCRRLVDTVGETRAL